MHRLPKTGNIHKCFKPIRPANSALHPLLTPISLQLTQLLIAGAASAPGPQPQGSRLRGLPTFANSNRRLMPARRSDRSSAKDIAKPRGGLDWCRRPVAANPTITLRPELLLQCRHEDDSMGNNRDGAIWRNPRRRHTLNTGQ